ncbi:Proline utilization trans-activator like protein [Verticillium longisporum]|nr:Proline utilization trans-activator like protein [Verticillium longisporum]
MAPEAPRRQQPKTRRTANACVSCRQSKIKCSGEVPCSNCIRRFTRCHFAEAGNKVVVSERLLQELRQQARGHRGSPSPDHYEAGGRAQPRGSPRRARQLNESQTWKERQRSAPRGHEAGYQLDRGWKRHRKSLTSESCSSQSHASHHDLSPRIPSHISFSPSGNPFAHPPQFTPCRAERQVSPPLAAEVGPRRRPHVAEACRLVFDVDDDELDFTETPALVRGRTHPERHLQETPKPEQEQEEPPSPRPLVSVLNSGSLTSQRFSLPSKIIKNKHPNGQGWSE